MVKIAKSAVDAGRRALVTGASSGIGLQIATVLAEEGFDLIITARREDRLTTLAETLRAKHRVDVAVIPADLAASDGIDQLYKEIVNRNLQVDVLVNNAGLGEPLLFHQTPWDRHLFHLNLMVVGPTQLTHLVLPGMLERGYGRVISISSMSAFFPGMPGHGLYCPMKSYLYKFSQSMAAEYEGTGVTFTVAAPGLTESEVIDHAGVRDMVDGLPGFLVADPYEVAKETVAAGLAGRAVLTNGVLTKIYTAMLHHFPSRWGHMLMIGEGDRIRDQLGGVKSTGFALPGLQWGHTRSARKKTRSR
jgi:short-subunit dehydrogenase